MKKYKIIMIITSICLVGIVSISLFLSTRLNHQEYILDGASVNPERVRTTENFTFACSNLSFGQFNILRFNRPLRIFNPPPNKAILTIKGSSKVLTETLRNSDSTEYTNQDNSTVIRYQDNQVFIKTDDTSLYPDCTLSSFTNPQDNIILQIPLEHIVVTVTGSHTQNVLLADYTDGDEKGSIVVLPQKITQISKVDDIKNEFYSIIPYAISTQGTGVFWHVALVHSFRMFPYMYGYLDTYYLGDRIQDIQIKDDIGMATITFLKHAHGQAMATPPTEKVTVRLSLGAKKMKYYTEE